MLTTIIAVVVVLGGLIFFHELGHFAVARGLGMGVSTFSLGFGPKILKYRKGKTEYALSLVPLGGYVALVGESDPKDIPEGFTEKESFALRPAWQRLLVVAAGPAANIILAWLLCWTLALGWGTPVLLPQVGGVVQNGPADKAGIQPGDTIVSINGAAVANWQAMADAITQSNGKTLAVTLSRPDMAPQADDQTRTDEAAQPEQGMIISVELTPERSIRKTIFGEEESAWLIGIRNSGAVRLVQHGFADAAIAGAGQTADMVSLTWQSFVKLAERVVPLDQVGGPIMIMQMVGKQAHEGLAGLLALAALISINLGILNLLPIPVLDGGQIVFCLWEIIFRRPLNARLQDYAMRAGIALLVALMLLATYNDLWRILKNTGWFGSGS
ncbi:MULTISPECIES: RIP metalloprotease RseP [Desulfovibrio]|uniref:RIP metalloprotease RseP n=1 Tax=Desulfovibrio TaxID=872 RepID=UPI001C0303AD|nr:RIP metalloprotease RseP [uncultured Desulfovibrio sp.]MBT9747670.1 RIP metalloprotease RseP [Desulfovibrio desulfuricans]MCH5143965.1 RIP metalloprotease RseP [Desulfovibrio sp. UIB00]